MTAAGDILTDWVPDRDSMCRICLCPRPIAKWSLFECTIVGRSIAEVLAEVGGIPAPVEGDRFPTVCCSDCRKQIEELNMFREKCQESHRRLGQIFDGIELVTVKQEAAEMDESMEDGERAEEPALTIAAIHGVTQPEETPAPPVTTEGPSQNNVISNFKVEGMEITIEVPGLQEIIAESVPPPRQPGPYDRYPIVESFVECCGCHKKFSTKKQLEDHVQTDHFPHRKPPAMVPKSHRQCDRCFKTVRNLKSHHTRASYCKICAEHHRDLQALNRHYKAKHVDVSTAVPAVYVQQRFECCGCVQIFKSQEMLTQHVQEVHLPQRTPPAERKKDTKECFRCFKSVKRVQEHLIRGNYCKVCSREFPDAKLAMFHYRNKHLREKVCDEVKVCCGCGAQFETIGELKIHSNQVHYQHRPPINADRPFKCEICYENYPDYAELDSHQTRFQQNNKPHRCSACERTFFFLNSLRDHEKTHTS